MNNYGNDICSDDNFIIEDGLAKVNFASKPSLISIVKEIREQEKSIINLTKQNLTLRNRNLKRTLLIILFTAVLSNLVDIIEFVKPYFQRKEIPTKPIEHINHVIDSNKVKGDSISTLVRSQ